MTAIDRLLFERFKLSVRSQAIFRILFASLLLINQYASVSPSLSSIPHEFLLAPLGPAQLVPIPSAKALLGLSYLLRALCILLLIGFHTRFVSLLLAGLFIVTRSWAYSLGKVGHDILFILVPACLAFSRWGHAFSIDTLRSRRNPSGERDQDAWPFALLAILVAFGMFTSGIQKAFGGWLDTSTSATVGWVVYMEEAWEQTSLAYPYLHHLLLLPPAVLESLDWVTVWFELLFPLGLLYRRSFQVLCMLAVLFHFGTFVLVDIYFTHQVTVYGAFFDWDRIASSWAALIRSLGIPKRSRIPSWILAIINVFAASAAIVCFVYRLVGIKKVLISTFTLMACIGLLVAIIDFLRWKSSKKTL